MITKAAMAAALVVTGLHLGAGPAAAAPVAPRIEAAATDSVEVNHRWRGSRHNYYRPRDSFRPYYRIYRPRHVCRTRFVVRYTYWGPQWVPVYGCYWR